jgi:hypothetical protein
MIAGVDPGFAPNQRMQKPCVIRLKADGVSVWRIIDNVEPTFD